MDYLTVATPCAKWALYRLWVLLCNYATWPVCRLCSQALIEIVFKNIHAVYALWLFLWLPDFSVHFWNFLRYYQIMVVLYLIMHARIKLIDLVWFWKGTTIGETHTHTHTHSYTHTFRVACIMYNHTYIHMHRPIDWYRGLLCSTYIHACVPAQNMSQRCIP